MIFLLSSIMQLKWFIFTWLNESTFFVVCGVSNYILFWMMCAFKEIIVSDMVLQRHNTSDDIHDGKHKAVEKG